MKKAATKSSSLWPAYKRLCNQCTNSIQKVSQDYHYSLVEETRNDPKKVWKTINRVLERETGGKSILSLNVNGKVVIEDGKLVEALNMHFASVGPKLAENIASKQNDNPFKQNPEKLTAPQL